MKKQIKHRHDKPRPQAQKKLRGDSEFGKGSEDIRTRTCFTHRGVRLSMSPADMLMWNALNRIQKKEHTKTIQNRINSKQMEYHYITYQNDLGMDETKYIYVNYGYKANRESGKEKETLLSPPERHGFSEGRSGGSGGQPLTKV